MTVDSSLIDRIVHGVLQQMQGAAPPRATPAAPAPSPATRPLAAEARLAHPVITAALIDEAVPASAGLVVVTFKAVITPAAIDRLRARKLTIRRESAVAETKSQSIRGLAVVVRSTPLVERALKQREPSWKRELLGCPDDAATLAIGSLCRGEVDRVLIFAAQTHRAACLANRNPAVKAVAVSSAEELRAAQQQLRVNVVCFDPTNRGQFELAKLLEHFEKV